MRHEHHQYADVHVRSYDDHIRRHRDFNARHVTVIADDNRYCAAVLVIHPYYGELDDRAVVDILHQAARAAEGRRADGDDRPAVGCDLDDHPAVRVPLPDRAVPAGSPADHQPPYDPYPDFGPRPPGHRYGSRADDPDADDDPN